MITKEFITINERTGEAIQDMNLESLTAAIQPTPAEAKALDCLWVNDTLYLERLSLRITRMR